MKNGMRTGTGSKSRADGVAENEYDLSINKYKKIESVPVEYPPTSEILANIRALESEINKELAALEELLK